jgi:PAS domain S-box-containing protein
VKLRLLIVEERQEDADLLVAELVRAGFQPDWTRVDTAEDLVEALYPAPDVVLCDHATPGLDALAVLSAVSRLRAQPPVIVVSGELDEEVCVKTLRMGAADYLLKDRLARLGPAVDHALAIRRLLIDKQAAERKERETAGILRGLVANAPAAISVKSVDGSYLLANRQFEALRGVGEGTLIGRIDAEVFPVQQAREMTELDARCLRDLAVMEREEEYVDASGPRHLLGVRYPVIDETGEVFGIGAIYLEITRQKRIEAQLREARAQLLSRAEMLGAGIEQLRELAADLARRCLDVIDRNSEHLMGLVEDLLVLSRADSSPFSGADQDVPVPAPTARGTGQEQLGGRAGPG